MSESKTLREISCADDYDPDSMPVERARELIRTFLVPVAATERDSHPRIARPHPGDRRPVAGGGPGSRQFGHGRVRGALPRPRAGSRDGARASRRIVRRQAQRRRRGRAGQCVRIFTGGVMPQGADTVVMQERAREEDGRVSIAAGAVAKEGANRRFAGEDLKPGQLVFRAGDLVHPAELGMMASLGIGEITVFRRLRVAFFPRATN